MSGRVFRDTAVQRIVNISTNALRNREERSACLPNLGQKRGAVFAADIRKRRSLAQTVRYCANSATVISRTLISAFKEFVHLQTEMPKTAQKFIRSGAHS